MNRILISNAGRYRLLRTIIQGIIAVLIANLDLLVAGLSFSPEVKVLIVPLIMAVLSPVMEYLGTEDLGKEDVPKGYFCSRLYQVMSELDRFEVDKTAEEKLDIAEEINEVFRENSGITYEDVFGILSDFKVGGEDIDLRELTEYIYQIFKGEEAAK